MTKHHPESLWCRYADDGICHCKTEEQAEALRVELEQRFKECKLEIHPEKTKIVYCKDGSRKGVYPGNTSFVFLGYEFRVRRAENKKTKEIFGGFLPAISPKAEKAITQKIRELNVRNKSNLSLQELAKWLNPMIQGDDANVPTDHHQKITILDRTWNLLLGVDLCSWDGEFLVD